jgi:hypothetical protein
MDTQRTLLLALALACPVSWAGSPFAFDGRVHDVKTQLPLEGVFIIVQWENTGGGLIDARTTCGNLFITQTDAQGRYHVPAYLPAISPFVDRYVTAYKIGYESAIPKRSMSLDEYDRYVRDIPMRVYTGTGDERINQYLSTGYLRTCGPDKLETFRKLHPLFRAIDQEIRTLEVSPEKREKQEGMIGFLEMFEKQLDRIEKGGR